MADTLTQLIAKVQAQLLDAATLFSTATVTAAVRQALADINRVAPLHAAESLTALADTRVYELSDYDPDALQMTGLLLQGEDEHDTPLPYYTYVEDGRVFFRLREAQPAGAILIVSYTRPHTVNGLDDETDSTLTDDLNVAILDGATYYCCMVRAGATAEANNVEPHAMQNWLDLAGAWSSKFTASLQQARHQPTAQGEPSALLWDDPWHDPQYP